MLTRPPALAPPTLGLARYRQACSHAHQPSPLPPWASPDTDRHAHTPTSPRPSHLGPRPIPTGMLTRPPALAPPTLALARYRQACSHAHQPSPLPPWPSPDTDRHAHTPTSPRPSHLGPRPIPTGMLTRPPALAP